ncbi:MAG TPA: amidohydrolase family protein [Desulfatiglandales bacterium]|nr:amidohydrolase family protein [Desulfatiglandales bacterium]
MGERIIIDGHIHCGPRKFQGTGGFTSDARRNDKEVWNPIERVKKGLEEASVKGSVLIPFPEDIYRGPDGTPESAKTAHEYIVDIAKNNDYFYPFYFVWNDFVIPDNLAEFKGIKWHRHFWEDSEYDYSDPKCDKFIKAIRKYDLPIIFEESFENTKLFCDKYPDLKVIIPHVGLANGGARNIIPRFKDSPNIYVDTALAYPFQIVEAMLQFGADRVIFGSDKPYSSTKIELYNLLEYDLTKNFSNEDIEKVLAKNILRLMHVSV